MPGRLLMPLEAGKTVRVYKLTISEASAGQETRPGFKAGSRSAFTRRHSHNVEYGDGAQQSRTSSSLEGPEMEHFAVISEDDELRSNESVSTASRASTRTSHTISDDDASFMEFVLDADFVTLPSRHSTACCSDLAFRRELRGRFLGEPAGSGRRRDSTSSFTLGNSFRRELEEEDRVESLALWEEADQRPPPSVAVPAAAQTPPPHSWHAGDAAAAASSRFSSRSRGLDAILRKTKSSFLTGFFSGLSFSTSRKARKSLG